MIGIQKKKKERVKKMKTEQYIFRRKKEIKKVKRENKMIYI